MTLVKNRTTKNYEADFRSTTGPVPRLHVSLKAKSKDVADDRHAAVKALFKQGNPQLITALRKRKVSVEAVTRVHQAQQPFETLLQSTGWPTIEKATKDYLRWMEHQADKSEGTIQSARLLLGHAADHFGKDRTLDSISHEEIEEYKTKLIEGGVTAWTAELQLVRLRALYNWIADRDGMSISTDNAGVACCGNCGAHVHVVCSGGCAEPDVVFRENYVATMRKPRGEEPRQEYRDKTPKPTKAAKYPPPTHCKCGEPVAQRAKFGVGRPPTKCEKHVVRKKVAS